MAVASIKGSAFGKVVDDLKKLAARDESARTAIAEQLSADEIALLESPVSTATWYSIETYARMNQILMDVEGDSEIEYLIARGAAFADRMIESGIYGQFDYLSRIEVNRKSDADARYAAFGRDLRLLATLSGSILNFSKWSYVQDPDHERRWMLELTDASDYPELLIYTTTGMINRMSERSRGENFWRWERVSRDTIRFRMTGDS